MLQVKLINDPFLSTEYMVYLFKYDSTHGPYPLPLECDNEFIVIGGKYTFFCILKKENESQIYFTNCILKYYRILIDKFNYSMNRKLKDIKIARTALL